MPELRRLELPMQTRQATFRPSTLDDKARTVELVWTTGATVRRRRFFGDDFDEQLVVDHGAVRLERLNKGAPVLDSHRRFGLDGVVGVVERAWIAGTEGRATVRFSDRDDVEPVWRDVKAGIIRNVSVGYIVHRAETVERRGDVPLMRVVDWEPVELSLVPVPADAGAQVRSADERVFPCEVVMPNPSPAPATDPAIAATRSTITLELPPAEQAERERVMGIMAAGRTLRLEREAEQMVERGVSLDEANRALLARAAERQYAEQIAGVGARVQGGISYDDPEVRRRAMADALAARICRTAPPEGQAREFMALSVIEMARETLIARGIHVGRNPGEVWTRVGALHTTSDFALLLADAQNKSLRQMYEAAESGVRVAARQTTARDFKTIHRLQSGEFPLPEKVNEHGEFTRGTMSESDETYSLATFGKVFGISRQAIINDDLTVFAQVVSKAAVASAEFVAAQLAAKIDGNPVMADGTPVFHANHGNLRSADANVDVASVSAAREAMRAQKGLDGEVFIRVSPRYLVVPPSLETEAEQLVAAITADQPANVNPFSGRLVVVVEPRLPSTAWYLAADPAVIDGLEFAFLDGEEGPQMETRIGFDVDGVETKLRIDFGCGWLDYRSWQKTPTA